MFLCYICYVLITRNNICLYLFIYFYIYHNKSHILQWCSAVSGVNGDVIKGNATMVTYRGLTFDLELKQSSNLTLSTGIVQQDLRSEWRTCPCYTIWYMYLHVHLRKLPTPPCSSLNSGVIRMSRVMKIHYRAFLANHAT